MAKSGENRVPSAKTSRGSQYPNTNAGHDDILQSAKAQMQPSIVTVDEVKKVLEAGKILRSVLTSEELANLHKRLYGPSKSLRLYK